MFFLFEYKFFFKTFIKISKISKTFKFKLEST